MLDAGFELAVPTARIVCNVEIEAYACALLAARMQQGAMDEAPIWTNLKTFDGRPWRGVVDCIIGGYPCQPFSMAGKRAGANDPRHLWPEIVRLIDEIGPHLCAFENVSGHLSLGFERVRRDLRERGYRVAAGLFTAAEVGASHERKRLFILADRGRGGVQRWGEPGESFQAEGRNEHAGDFRAHVADRESINDNGSGRTRRGRNGYTDSGSQLEHADGVQRDRQDAPNDGRYGFDLCAGGKVADASDSGHRRREDGKERSAERGVDAEWAGGGIQDMADTSGARSQGESAIGSAQSDFGSAGRSGGAEVPLFAPGPGATDEWRRIL